MFLQTYIEKYQQTKICRKYQGNCMNRGARQTSKTALNLYKAPFSNTLNGFQRNNSEALSINRQLQT
jgi:hypothetical protein